MRYTFVKVNSLAIVDSRIWYPKGSGLDPSQVVMPSNSQLVRDVLCCELGVLYTLLSWLLVSRRERKRNVVQPREGSGGGAVKAVCCIARLSRHVPLPGFLGMGWD